MRGMPGGQRPERRRGVNIHEAFEVEIAKSPVIYSVPPSECHICKVVDECRIGVCYECRERVETDMVEVWDRFNPANKWPYEYRHA